MSNSLYSTITTAKRSPRPPKKEEYLLDGAFSTRVDEYYWMREKTDPDLVEYLQAENEYFDEISSTFKEDAADLLLEIRSRIVETDLSVPVPKGPYEYFTQTEEGKQYSIYKRRRLSDGKEEELLDENSLAAGKDYFSIGSMAISSDHLLLAYSSDLDGSEMHELRIKDLATGKELGEAIANTYYGLAWSKDSRFIFYVRADAAMRPWRVYRHKLYTDPEMDEMVYEESDERFFVDISKTKDECFITIDIQSKSSSEVRLIAADDPTRVPELFLARREGIEYELDHHEEGFFMVTNDGREDFRLLFKSERMSSDSWSDFAPLKDSERLEGIEIFATHLILLKRHLGNLAMEIIEISSGSRLEFSPLEEIGTIYPTANANYVSEVFRYEYSSFRTPRGVYEYDFLTKTTRLLKETQVLGGYDSSDYETYRIWADAEDGTRIPLSIVHRKDIPRNGQNPVLLYGYGSYEYSLDPSFSSIRLSLLDRGFIFALAHVRGGGEMGRRWYREGKLYNKMNTFTDFIACAERLCDGQLSSLGNLYARGGSAGGLLVGAVINLAPDLFKGVIAEVPFVDCLTTISDPTLPLTVTEWEEWGNPIEDHQTYELMLRYSPYDNVGPQNYPFLFVTAGLNDPRVSYWEPLKWVARIRDRSPQTPVIMKIDMGAGHMGPSGRYDAWYEEAVFCAFLLNLAGITLSKDTN